MAEVNGLKSSPYSSMNNGVSPFPCEIQSLWNRHEPIESLAHLLGVKSIQRLSSLSCGNTTIIRSFKGRLSSFATGLAVSPRILMALGSQLSTKLVSLDSVQLMNIMPSMTFG